MTNAKRKPFLTTRELATVAILAAISAVLFMIEIPVVLFYKLDLSHLPVLLGILCATGEIRQPPATAVQTCESPCQEFSLKFYHAVYPCDICHTEPHLGF